MPIHGYPGNVITANPTAPTVSSASGVWTTEQQLINQSAGRWPMAATQISRSLRFNSADSAYLSRTPASASNRKTWTWSGWVKRSLLGARNAMFTEAQSGYSTYFSLYFETDNTIAVHGVFGGTALLRQTAAVFRDVSAWYHVVIAVDTTQATDSNRILLYVNGVNYSLPTVVAGSWPTQNSDGGVNLNQPHEIGRRAIDNDMLANFYLAEVNFIDGLALTPAYFGFNDSNTGVWTPRQYTGAYGTNGFYVNFSDNSNTTAATLGKDYSGNGNNWTPNNFSVTAGAGNDSMVDSPTSYGTDTGVGGEVRGNYATLNPLNVPTSTTFSNGNLQVTNSAFAAASSTIAPQSGKWYMEFVCSAVGSQTAIVGVSNRLDAEAFNGNTQTWQLNYTQTGILQNAGTNNTGYSTWTTNDVLGLAFNCDTGAASFYKNNTLIGTITNSAFASVPVVFGCGGGGSSGTNAYTANFGQRAFAYTAPSGFKALCTQNLPTPTIGATSTTQANDYMNVVTWTGVNSTAGRSVTGVGFSPDFVWAKRRSASADHLLYDTIRGAGVTKELSSNLTLAEGANNTDIYDYLSSFDADGFSSTWSGSNTAYYFNELNATYVAWNWNAGGSTVTNTSGTISAQVRASTTSGFSIVTYTGNGTSGATVGHGLGVTPGMMIVKVRNDANSWRVYHSSLGATKSLLLETSDSVYTQTGAWNDTAPTSTVFSVGNFGSVNGNTNTYVAYCFAAVAGYSAFGSYTGNGSADGPFVFTNFRPRFILIKRTDSTANWRILDTARDTYNVEQYELYPNLTNAEGTFSALDGLSNGFKIRTSDTAYNASGGTYIYAAFAESPFKFSLAR